MKNHLVFALKVCSKFPDYIFQLIKFLLNVLSLIGSFRRLRIVLMHF